MDGMAGGKRCRDAGKAQMVVEGCEGKLAWHSSAVAMGLLGRTSTAADRPLQRWQWQLWRPVARIPPRLTSIEGQANMSIRDDKESGD